MDAMIPFLIFAAAFLAGQVPEGGSSPPTPEQPAPTEVEEVVVVGERAREAAEAYVRSVAAPIPGRKAAAWRGSVCVGVLGMQADAARFMADRVSDWAHSVGLEIEDPGCRPSIIITATDDGNATARELVAASPREFRLGASGSDRGRAALEAFQNTPRLIRWWHVSLPVNDDTGLPVVRLPGQSPFAARQIRSPADLGPYGRTVAGSSMIDHTRDDLMQAIIVLDVAALEQASFSQITDYVAMVALAQIDPDVEPAYPSILGLFSQDGTQQQALTRWDRAYLAALYSAAQTSAMTGANLSSIATTLARELDGDEADDAPGAAE